ncbi:MAG: MmcQ/YjbR family DNA-binding protein [Roseicyclus sp.]
MHEAFADRICSTLEDAVRGEPFGPGMVVWTIGGRMFAAYTEPGEGLSIRVRHSAAGLMLARGEAVSHPDLSGAGWVLIPWATPPEVLRHRIAVSYALVLSDGNGAGG